MADYNLFTENSVFADSEVNTFCNQIFGHVFDTYPDKVSQMCIGGGVGLILQGKDPYHVKDVDIIVTDRQLFEDLQRDLPPLFRVSIRSSYLRFWLPTSKIWFEFWYVDKTANLVYYKGIPLERLEDILTYQ